MARRLRGEDSYPAALLTVAGHGAARPFPAGPHAWSELINTAKANRGLGQPWAVVDSGLLAVGRHGASGATRLFPDAPHAWAGLLATAKANRVQGAVDSRRFPVTSGQAHHDRLLTEEGCLTRRLCGEDSYPAALLAVAGRGTSDATRSFLDAPHAGPGLLASAKANRVRGAVDSRRFPVTSGQGHHDRLLTEEECHGAQTV